MKTPAYFDALQKRWERVHEYEERAFQTKKEKRARGSEVMAALAGMYAATGKAVYRDAFQEMQEDGFDRGKAGAYAPLHEKSTEKTCLNRMHRLIQRRRWSMRRAAAVVAVDFWIRGKTFDAVVTRLETAYGEVHR